MSILFVFRVQTWSPLLERWKRLTGGMGGLTGAGRGAGLGASRGAGRGAGHCYVTSFLSAERRCLATCHQCVIWGLSVNWRRKILMPDMYTFVTMRNILLHTNPYQNNHKLFKRSKNMPPWRDHDLLWQHTPPLESMVGIQRRHHDNITWTAVVLVLKCLNTLEIRWYAKLN